MVTPIGCCLLFCYTGFTGSRKEAIIKEVKETMKGDLHNNIFPGTAPDLFAGFRYPVWNQGGAVE